MRTENPRSDGEVAFWLKCNKPAGSRDEGAPTASFVRILFLLRYGSENNRLHEGEKDDRISYA